MLYDAWREVADRSAGDLAVADFTTNTRWTFRELGREAELEKCDGPISFPRGGSIQFLLEVLRAWRAGSVVCPIEMSQAQPSCPIPPGEARHLKVTSGTTGLPQLIAFTPGQLKADCRNIIETMGLRPEWPNLGTISLAHSYGFSNLVLPLLLAGIPLILAPAPLPEMIRTIFREFSAVSLPAVPALWQTWVEAGVIDPETIKLAISAGAPLPLPLEQQAFHTSGLKIHNFYGSSECGGIAFDRSDSPRNEATFAGEAMENVNLFASSDGCLIVESEAVGESYWPKPENRLGRGRFQTSDLVELHGQSVWLRGRAGDQINVAGRKISPESIENVLRTHAAVDECVVFGVPSNEAIRADDIVACVVSRQGVAEEELKSFVLQRLPAWQLPRDWWFIESPLSDERGKISRSQWRERYLGQRHATVKGRRRG